MSAFEADRFNRSRTSPRHESGSGNRNRISNCRGPSPSAQDLGDGLTALRASRPSSASTFEADRFNHSRTSPRQKEGSSGLQKTAISAAFSILPNLHRFAITCDQCERLCRTTSALRRQDIPSPLRRPSGMCPRTQVSPAWRTGTAGSGARAAAWGRQT